MKISRIGGVLDKELQEALQWFSERFSELWDLREGDMIQSETWVQGYIQGLRAARDAVAAIPKEDGGYCHVLHACDVEAAIDYLLENN